MTSLLFNLLLIAAGGALGGAGRFWVSELVARRYGEAFPWGTLVVNVSGATGIGVLAGLLLTPGTHAVADGPLWTALIVGMLGSYTTVSAFSLQTLALLRAGARARAALNVTASLVLCIGGAAAGAAAVLALTGGA